MLSNFTSQLGSFMGKKGEGTPAPEEGGTPPVEPAAGGAAVPTQQPPQQGGSVLSSFTSQIGSFISSKKGPAVEGGEEATAPTTTEPGATSLLPSSLSSTVKNHIPSWLLGKQEPAAETPDPPTTTTSFIVQPPTNPDSKASTPSSATGGADSEKEDTGLEKVKSIGSYLFSSVKAAGQKIKETNLLENFQREHESFLKSKGGKASDGLAPWVGHPKEEALREEVIGLSGDRRNFVRAPPPGVPFNFEWSEYEPVAMALLKEDKNLVQMRYDLVPKIVSEEAFWRNYFYRVTLLRESMEDSSTTGTTTSNRHDSDIEKELNEELKSFEVVGSKLGEGDEREIDAMLDLK